MMKSWSILSLMMISLPLFAQSMPTTNKPFPIDVEIQGEDLGVSAASGQISNIATVTLTHNGDQPVVCETHFVNGPERPHRSRVRLQPGEQTVVTQAFMRQIIRVRVTVACSGS